MADPESVARAWREQEEFRDDVVYAIARSVSDSGTFESADEWIRVLPQVLTADEAAELYVDVLEQTHRLESEWRPAFVRAFPKAEALLPDPADLDILVGTIEQLIIAAYEEGFETAVEQLVALAGGRPAIRETLLPLAERLGHTAMTKMLREAARLPGA